MISYLIGFVESHPDLALAIFVAVVTVCALYAVLTATPRRWK